MIGFLTAAKTRAALAGSPFDWLWVGLPENVAYLTGYRSVATDLFRDASIGALCSVDETFLVAAAADSGPALADGVIDSAHFVPFGNFYFESDSGQHPASYMAGRYNTIAAASGALINEAVAPDEVLGADSHGAAHLADGLKGSRVVEDATDWMAQLRSTKLPEEVAVLEKSARLAEQAVATAIEQIAPGQTEIDLAKTVAGTMVDGGASPRFIVVASGERSALADTWPTDRVIARGDLVRFDVGCVLNGYWSDIARTAIVGTPSPTQQSRYDALLAGEQAMLERARPGLTAAELFKIAIETVEGLGIAPYRRHHCGHAIGLQIYERPIVAPASDAPLEPGMTFCLETPFYELGWGGMMVEDAVVITDDGLRLLTQSPRTLIQVP